MTTVGQTDEKPTGRTLFGHPIGLANLFGVELWERFSFYGMLTILGYYLYCSLTEGGLELPKRPRLASSAPTAGTFFGIIGAVKIVAGVVVSRSRPGSAARWRACTDHRCAGSEGEYS